MPRRLPALLVITCVCFFFWVVIFGQMKNRSQSIAASAKRPSSSAASVAKSLQCKRLRRQTWCECAICEGKKIKTKKKYMPAIELCGIFVTQIAQVISKNNLEKKTTTKWTQQLWRSNARGGKEVGGPEGEQGGSNYALQRNSQPKCHVLSITTDIYDMCMCMCRSIIGDMQCVREVCQGIDSWVYSPVYSLIDSYSLFLSLSQLPIYRPVVPAMRISASASNRASSS